MYLSLYLQSDLFINYFRLLKNFNDISNRQRRRRIANELLNIDHDLNTLKNIQAVSTPPSCPVLNNILVSIKPSKSTEPIDMFSVSNGINNDNVQNTFSYNTCAPNFFYEFSSNNFSCTSNLQMNLLDR